MDSDHRYVLTRFNIAFKFLLKVFDFITVASPESSEGGWWNTVELDLSLPIARLFIWWKLSEYLHKEGLWQVVAHQNLEFVLLLN